MSAQVMSFSLVIFGALKYTGDFLSSKHLVIICSKKGFHFDLLNFLLGDPLKLWLQIVIVDIASIMTLK